MIVTFYFDDKIESSGPKNTLWKVGLKLALGDENVNSLWDHQH